MNILFKSIISQKVTRKAVSLKDIKQRWKPFDVTNVKAKVAKKNDTKFVSHNKLKVAEAGSASIKLDIWEDQIPLVEVHRAYSFVGVRVREWNNNLSLSTSQNTKIEELLENESGTLSSVNVDVDHDVITMSAKVSSVVSMKASKHLYIVLTLVAERK